MDCNCNCGQATAVGEGRKDRSGGGRWKAVQKEPTDKRLIVLCACLTYAAPRLSLTFEPFDQALGFTPTPTQPGRQVYSSQSSHRHTPLGRYIHYSASSNRSLPPFPRSHIHKPTLSHTHTFTGGRAYESDTPTPLLTPTLTPETRPDDHILFTHTHTHTQHILCQPTQLARSHHTISCL